jgi:hypothetical protein
LGRPFIPVKDDIHCPTGPSCRAQPLKEGKKTEPTARLKIIINKDGKRVQNFIKRSFDNVLSKR